MGGQSKNSANCISRGVLALVLAMHRRATDARFIRVMGLRPTFASRILGTSLAAWLRFWRVAGSAYQDVVFSEYVDRLPLHYGPGGRGYQTVGKLTVDEREARYAGGLSRLEFFVDRFPMLLDYRDGDSFLDLGCGTGQNVRMIVNRYPTSIVRAVDVNADAIEFVREMEASQNLTLECGNLLDDSFLEPLLAMQPDHIVLSHVFTLLMGASKAETIALRAELIHKLARACRKSLVIVDAFGPRGVTKIFIEQVNRAEVLDDGLSYFSDTDGGIAVLVHSPDSQAVIFLKGAIL